MSKCGLDLNPGCDKCKDTLCRDCGWNPEVSAARIRRLRTKGPTALMPKKKEKVYADEKT